MLPAPRRVHTSTRSIQHLISRHVNTQAYMVQQKVHMSFEQQSACMAAAVSLCQPSEMGASHRAAHGCGHWHRAPRQRLAPQSPLHHWTYSARAGRGLPETGAPRSPQQCGPPGRRPVARPADSGPRLCPRPAKVMVNQSDCVLRDCACLLRQRSRCIQVSACRAAGLVSQVQRLMGFPVQRASEAT